jgi:hypothetical protein
MPVAVTSPPDDTAAPTTRPVVFTVAVVTVAAALILVEAIEATPEAVAPTTLQPARPRIGRVEANRIIFFTK